MGDRYYCILAFILTLVVSYVLSPHAITQIVKAQTPDSDSCKKTLQWAQWMRETYSESFLGWMAGTIDHNVKIACGNTSQAPQPLPKSETPITGCEPYSGSQYNDCINSQLDDILKGVKDPCGDPLSRGYMDCLLGAGDYRPKIEHVPPT